MMNEKYKNKIKKLLALTQSDNTHEAERARVQAQKLMAKYNICSGDIEIMTIKGKAIGRKNFKQSEVILLHAIRNISACEYYLSIKSKPRGIYGRRRYLASPMFMGLENDAELAAYSWDVLLNQLILAQKKLKQDQPRLTANNIEYYSEGRAYTASEKLINVFGKRKAPSNVEKLYEREYGDLPSNKARKAKKSDDADLDLALQSTGFDHGENARLHIATNDCREKTNALEFIN